MRNSATLSVRRAAFLVSALTLVGGCSLLWDPDERQSGDGSGAVGGVFLDASTGGSSGSGGSVAGAGGSVAGAGGQSGGTDGGQDAAPDAQCPVGLGDCTSAPGCETDLTSSSEHCGQCGRSCPVCTAGKCAPELLGTFEGLSDADHFGTFVRVTNTTLYAVKRGAAVNGGDVYRIANPDAANPGSMERLNTGIVNPIDVLPMTEGLIVTANSGTYGFASGSNEVLLNESSWGIARLGDEVTIAMQGSRTFDATALGQFLQGGVAPSPTSTVPGTYLSVARSGAATCRTLPAAKQVDCDSWSQLLSVPNVPYVVVMDSEYAYWGDEPVASFSRGLSRAALAGPTATQVPLFQDGGGVAGIALDGDDLFFALRIQGRVERMNKAGGPREVLADGLVAPFGVVLDTHYLYFSTESSVYRLRR